MGQGTRDEEELMWAAAKREFVADARDERADGRDSAADARDAAADDRDHDADAREAALEERETRLGAPITDSDATVPEAHWMADPAAGRADRARAEEDRAKVAVDRGQAATDREEAWARRLADSPTLLAMAFAEIAAKLYDAETFDDVLTRIAEAAVDTVTGAASASVTLRLAEGYRTAAATDPAAAAVDQEQYEVEEGPGLDAFTVSVVSAPSFPDDRWPKLGSRPLDHGVQSSLSYQLATPVRGSGSTEGSLNAYGTSPESFDASAREIGTILAAHAALAARAVGERGSLEGLGQQLAQALLTRDVIGQAKGILMERLKATPEDAFDILRHASQRLNVKLREVALRVTETGDIDNADIAGSAEP